MTKVEELREIIKEADGLLIGVSFYKSDGSLRKMIFRNGVITGHPAPEWNDKRNQTLHEKGMMNVYDVKVNGYRTINLNNVIHLKVRGKEYNYD